MEVKKLDTGALEFIKKVTEDALWEEVAMEFIEKLDYDFQKMFRRNKTELETLGRYILSERSRKYYEGMESARVEAGVSEESSIVNSFLGGFTLCATRTESGKLSGAVGDMLINEWPEEVSLAGHTYTLEATTLDPETDHAEAHYC